MKVNLTPAEHYAKAEEILANSKAMIEEAEAQGLEMGEVVVSAIQVSLQMGQIHATLALWRFDPLSSYQTQLATGLRTDPIPPSHTKE